MNRLQVADRQVKQARTTLDKALAARVEAVRDARDRGMTLAAIGEVLGVSHPMVVKILKRS